jgi:hypothetical protein
MIVFDAWKATHAMVRAALGHPQSHFDEGGCNFWVVLDGDEPFSEDWRMSDDDLVRDGIRLIAGRGGEALEGFEIYGWFAAEEGSAPKP